MRESPSPVSQPVVYHHGDLPNALLDAIAEIVEEKDSADVSLREVARRAGVSHSAPAHHFGDKEGMLAAFCDRGYEILRSEMQEARDGAATGDALDRIGAVGAAYVRFAVDHRPYFEVMFHSGIEKEAYGDLYTCAKNALGVLMEVVAEFSSEMSIYESWPSTSGPWHTASPRWPSRDRCPPNSRTCRSTTTSLESSVCPPGSSGLREPSG